MTQFNTCSDRIDRFLVLYLYRKEVEKMKKSTKIIILIILILFCILKAMGGISMGIAVA